MKTMKKFFASFLVLCMVLTMPNICANAAEGTGTEEDPIILETLGEVTTSVDASTESSSYVYYSYTAPSTLEGTGMITVSVTSATAGAYYAINFDNMTTGAYGQIMYNENYGVNTTTGTVKVAAGETVIIKVYNMYTSDSYPAVTVNWTASVKSVGTADSPEDMGSLKDYQGSYGYTYETSLVPGTEYYYSYTMEETGEFVAYVNYNWSSLGDADTLLPEIIVTNTTTGATSALSTSTYQYEENWYGNVTYYDAVSVEASQGDELVIAINSSASAESVLLCWNATLALPAPAGSSIDNPIVITESAIETPSTATIPANSEYYFSFPYNFAGATVTITPNDTYANYAVNVNGVPTYSAADGSENTVSVTLENSALYGVVISVYNSGFWSDLEVSISVEIPEGTELNPKEVVLEDGKTEASVEVELAEGHIGYYLEWVAPEDGYLNMNIASSVDDVWYYTMYTDNEDSVEYYYSYGNSADYVADPEAVIYVEKGDVVTLVVMAMDCENGYTTVEATLSVDLEYLELAEGSVAHSIQAIENTTEGEDAAVEIVLKDAEGNATMVIPADVLDALKGKEISAVIMSDYYAWVINGKDIETVETLDLTVNVDTLNIPEALVEKAVGDFNAGQFSIADNDDFGLVAALVFMLGEDYVDEAVSLLYYNEDGNLECVGNEVVDEDGYVAFAFEHASDYVLVQGDIEVGTIVEPDVADNGPDGETIPDNGDVANMMVYVIVLMGAALVVTGFAAKKRFA